MEHDITTEAKVQAYNAAHSVFSSLLSAVEGLSKKKPDTLLTAVKLKILNRVLDDLLTFLPEEPEGKYLQRLDDDPLPQVSDALFQMAQFRAALDAFHSRHTFNYHGEEIWLTPEGMDELEAKGVFANVDSDDDDDEDEHDEVEDVSDVSDVHDHSSEDDDSRRRNRNRIELEGWRRGAWRKKVV